ncbi:MAG TPA: EscU/YscU/HrcU family type III secretion system export apparatus switch protein [Acidimicrobiales bacterium]|nr:EscU/YscU/HrcU family type III secretion system export apparatus switch protein [Acidimicrobiales bacterium]
MPPKEDKSQKTEKATERKKREAKKEGQVAKSKEVMGWATLLGTTFAAPFLLGGVASALQTTLVTLPDTIVVPDEGTMLAVTGETAIGAFMGLMPMLLTAAAIAIFGSIAQTGLMLTPKALKPKLSHVSPAKGLKRLFSVQSLWQTVMQLGKLVIIGLVSVPILYGTTRDLIASGFADLSSSLELLFDQALVMLRLAAALGLTLAVLDFAFQKWKTERDLRMSKQEVKQEMKNSEGDPIIKMRQRSARMAMSRNRMIASVADADVVVVNPTHVAVALKYTGERGAPRVVARGADAVAKKIRDAARDAEVPIVRSRLLARAIYESCRVDDEIPRDLFEAVATVLAFVHRLRGRPSLTGDLLLELPVTWAGDRAQVAREHRRSLRRRRAKRGLGGTRPTAAAASSGG